MADSGATPPAAQDWTGKSNAERRRIQNRLNQRASRRRKAQQQNEAAGSSGPRRFIIYVDKQDGRAGQRTPRPALPAPTDHPGQMPKLHICDLTAADQERFMQGLQRVVNRGLTDHLFSEHLLAPVSQFNIILAMYSNATYLGLTVEMLKEDIISPFNTPRPAASTLNAPPSLQPTALQRQVVHHPWLDLCPVASVRDCLLRNAGRYDEEELCFDFYTGTGDGEGRTGVLVWGEAWDPASYEMSSVIAKKWSWILRECPDVVSATNFWRETRGEAPLVLDDETGDFQSSVSTAVAVRHQAMSSLD